MRLRAIQKVWIIGILGILFVVGTPISLGLPLNQIGEIRRIRPVTPLTPIYYLQVSRESLQKLFVFGDEDLAHFQLLIAQKRINEAIYLKSIGLTKMAMYQKAVAEKELRVGESYLQKIPAQVNIDYIQKIRSDNEKLLISL